MGQPETAPRIRPRDPEEVDTRVRRIFEAFQKERGNIPNMFRTVGMLPKHLTTMIAHFSTVMNEGTVPVLLKELLSIRVSSINLCRY
jgi:hypothetical protein